MRRLPKLLLPILTLVCANTFAATDCPKTPGPERPSDVVAKEAETKLLNRDFTGLEALAAAYRDPAVVSAEGLPKMQAFYSDLLEPIHGCNQKATAQAWLDRKQLIDAWNKAKPDSVAAKIGAAYVFIGDGWRARGEGYASTVSDEGWKLFAERAAQARSVLEQPAVKASHNPAWFDAMMDVALMQGWKPGQYDMLYAEAVDRYPFYYGYYFKRANYYSPKWFGEEGDLDKVVVADALKRTQARIGQAVYARIHWSQSDPDQFTNGQTDWKRMKRGFQDMIAAYPDPWNRNNFAQFACRANDWATFKEQVALLGDNNFMPAAWGGSKGGFIWCEANSQIGGIADPTKPVLYSPR